MASIMVEKHEIDGTSSQPASRSTLLFRRFVQSLILVLYLHGAASLGSYAVAKVGDRFWPLQASVGRETSPGSPFDWAKAPTLPNLEYSPCYDGFQCARLELPLDYFNGTTNDTISLAVVKLPAIVPVTDPRYGGAILFNPGGPGGSGVGFLLGAAPRLRSVLDAQPGEDGKYFDLVSFDPRGIGLSEPAMSCHGTAGSVKSWFLRSMEEGTLTSSDAALGRLWSMNQAQWVSCAMTGDDDIMHYMATSSVATDMIGIAEAHGRWREQEAIRLAKLEHVPVNRDLSYKPGAEMVQYWGFSYGSFLGTTFISMYPERVGRVILDGVVDAEDYKLNLWYDNLVDTEKDMDSFYHHCARIGFPTCPLANPNRNTSAIEVKNRTLGIIASFYHNPLPVLDPDPEVISWSDVRGLVFASLYSPVAAFPFLANVLAQLEQGDGTELARLLKVYHSVQCSSDQETGLTPPLRNVTESDGSTMFAGSVVLCTDGDVHDYLNKSAFVDHLQALQSLSPTLGDIWAQVNMPCVSFPLRSHHRYAGPWTGNTSHPVLWIGNTADPVTPLVSAKKNAQGFPGSIVLTQDSPGHCSISAFSKCTTGYIRDYFQTGALPPKDKVCAVDQIPWGPMPGDDVAVTEEVRLGIQNHGEIASAWHRAGGALGRSRLLGRLDESVFT